MIEPFYERTRQSETHLNMSFGLGPAGYDLRIAEDILLAPGGFTLASSLEHFMFPADVQGELKDKSSWARRGLTVQNTVFDPGFRGFPTLELANHSAEEIRIRYGTAIAQMIFHLLDEPTESPYDGKYQDQQAGPQPAR
jgi:dCTP deaminase